MAAEIHDSLAQSLTFVRMRMPLLRDAVSRQDEARALRYCNDLDQELGSANRRMRELITHFRAGMGAQGLEHALGQAADTFREQTGIPLEFDCRVPGFELPADQEVQIFHMVQEALANVRRHSGAHSVKLWVDRSGDELVFGIDDDGSGFPEPVGAGADPAALPSSFGLEIMRQRAQSIGARVSFERAPGRGARVAIRVPFAGLKSGAVEAVAEVSRG
jgi:two-component system nitrate/nitrite sensor histidine kinase NarX